MLRVQPRPSNAPAPERPASVQPVHEEAGAAVPRSPATDPVTTAEPEPAATETKPTAETESAATEIKPAATETEPVAVEAQPTAEVSVPEAPGPAAEVPVSEVPEPEAGVPVPEAPETDRTAPVAAKFAAVDRERPVPSIERALSGPGSGGEVSWRRQVKVVTGGQGPGKRDQATLDRDRARLPLAGPRRIVVLGCTRGAGQTVTALMTGHILAAARGTAVAALDLNPGATSLAARRAPAASVRALLDGHEPSSHEPSSHEPSSHEPSSHEPSSHQPSSHQPNGHQPHDHERNRHELDPSAPSSPAARLDVIACLPGTILDGDDFQRLSDLLVARYPLTMIDPAPSGLTRVLSAADQLVLVAPASPDAATALANTQQWLAGHGYGELAARAVTVVNGASRRTMEDVLRAESVARGRSRAIVRVPWDDVLSGRPATSAALNPQTRLAYTALAGVLVAGLAAEPASAVPGRNPGEHAD